MSTQNAHTNMMKALLEKAREKILRFDCDYSKMLNELEKYQQNVIKLDNLALQGDVLNTIGLLHCTFGYLEASQTSMAASLSLFQQIHSEGDIIRLNNNLAHVANLTGEHDKALEYCRQALHYPHVNEFPVSHGFVLSNLITALISTEQYADVPQCLTDLEALAQAFVQADKQRYAYMMTYVYRNGAELALHEGKLDDALRKVKLGIELAKGLALRLELGILYFTMAHIEVKQNSPSTESEYFAKALETLSSIGSPITLALALLSESRYLQRQQYTAQAREFAQQARDIFAEHQLTEQIARADNLLNIS